MIGLVGGAAGTSITELPIHSQFRRVLNGQTEAAVVCLTDESYPWSNLGRLSSLGVNWDSYGAAPIEALTINRAQILWLRLHQLASRLDLRVHQPKVLAGADGSVGLLWRNVAKTCDYELIVTRSSAEFAATKDGVTTDGTVESLSEILATLLNLKLVS